MPPTSSNTTLSVERTADASSSFDDQAGMVLIYARSHEGLPGAFPLCGREATAGRAEDCDVHLPEASVSRRHVRFTLENGRWWVHDNGSTNGCFINGRRIQSHRLRAQDVLRIGDVLLRYTDRAVLHYAAYPLGVTSPDGSHISPTHTLDSTSEEAAPPSSPGSAQSPPTLVGGYQIQRMLSMVDRLASSPLSVLVLGQSGTGKELVARRLHQVSGRTGAFQAVNCAAIPGNLIESELFGSKKGAFTGADRDREGVIQAAQGGTLFLDEIGEMPVEAQAKILRVIQEREVVPVGASRPVAVDVRVVTATHRDLEQSVKKETFRGDLLARLRQAVVRIPPLRDRREDLFRLVQYFLVREAYAGEVSAGLMGALAHYDWPYNVRELENAIRYAVVVSTKDRLERRHLPENIRHARSLDAAGGEATGQDSRADGDPLDDPLMEDAEDGVAGVGARGQIPDREEIVRLLSEHRGNVSQLARAVGRSRMQVHRWIQRHKLNAEDYRSGKAPSGEANKPAP